MRVRLTNRGFGLLGVILLILVIAVATASGWAVYHHGHTVKQSATTTVKGSTKNTVTSPTTTTVSTVDGKVSMTLPNTWHILGDKQIIGAGNQSTCLDVDDASPCIYQAEFQPNALSSVTGQLWSITVEKTSWTISQASNSLLGELNAQNTITQDSSPINGYDTLYAKVGSTGSSVGDYVDIHYFIEKDGYLVHFSNREKFNGQTGSQSDTWDNSEYSSAFDTIVRSLKLNV